MNNFEKIKAMDIDEMVEWLIKNFSYCSCGVSCPAEPFCGYDVMCKDGMKQWLESEVRE